jgi:hypothetical protein
MKTSQFILFAVPIGVMSAGFSIGGRDGAIFSLIGAAALFGVSIWQMIKALEQSHEKPKQ